MSLASHIKRQLQDNFSQASGDDNETLNDSLRLLASGAVFSYRTLLEREGTTVLQGPLAGLDFIRESAEGCHVAKLLGCYEQPLQRHIRAALSGRYTKIISVVLRVIMQSVSQWRCLHWPRGL